MEITVSYSSSRAEIATRYWQTWRTRLWKIHLFVFVIVFFFVVSLEGHWPIRDYRFLVYASLTGIVVLFFFILFPQAMYKSQVRTLTVNEDGMQTVIGSRTGKTDWREILSIEEDEDEHIIIVAKKTYNAMLIPKRAFQSDVARKTFLTAIREWHEAAQESHP
ncbi:MAG: YcxB family protein [Anaerolineales bacterium]|nr:MAG: YcxB family protein [Anaerolineales bacterium]